jgi:hypothetical protein
MTEEAIQNFRAAQRESHFPRKIFSEQESYVFWRIILCSMILHFNDANSSSIRRWWCYLSLVHPSKPIRDKYVNREKGHKLENLKIIALQEKVVRRGTAATKVYVFLHDDFPDEEFYACTRYVHLTQEGPEDGYFAEEEAVAAPARVACQVQANTGRTDDVDEVNIPFARNSNLAADDMAELWRQRITIDDDNDPVPGNIPIPELRVDRRSHFYHGSPRVSYVQREPQTCRILTHVS